MSVDLCAVTNRQLNSTNWKTYGNNHFPDYMGSNGDDVFIYFNGKEYKDINTSLTELGFPIIPCRYLNCEFRNPLYDLSVKLYDKKLNIGEDIDYFKLKRKIDKISFKNYYYNDLFIKEHKPNYKREECIPFSGCKCADLSDILHYTREKRNKEECGKLYKLWIPDLFEKLKETDKNLYICAYDLYRLYKKGYFFFYSV